ncbi:Eukaryotic translation initiation factor 3 subunit I [Conglomerata obtusa]
MTIKASQTNLTLHDRPITDLQFNKDGDLLFAASKDASISLYRLKDTIIGTYSAHKGAINSISINDNTTKMASGAADKYLILWDINGDPIYEKECESMVKSVYLYEDKLLYCTDDSFSKQPKIGIIDDRSGKKEYEQIMNFNLTKAVIDYKRENIVVGDCDGGVSKIDLRNNKTTRTVFHSAKINSVKNSACGSFFVTGSSDAQVKIINYELEEIRCFVTEDPVNSAVIMRSNTKLVSAGGINARDVTLTRSKTNFSVNFFDVGTKNLVGGFSTHYGTINCVDVHPNEEMYCSGGEEGIICIVEMGQDFYDAPFTNY